MRRNTVTFLKYLILAFLAVSFLVITINLFSSQRTVRPVDSAAAHFQNQLFPKESDQNADSPQKALAVAAGDPLELIDWHNYTQIKLESERSGPGEQGNPVEANPAEKDEYNRLFAANGFSGLTSDKISLHRAIRDIRHSSCKNERYQRSLPSVSIVIPFYEEHFSTLLRTVYSCVERAPSNIVKEVILVDDGSNKEFLKKQLDDYVKEHFTGFTSVRVMRQKQREGLIRTRLLGARNATGDVIIFLDSHCECNVNYLPPLLHPIAQDYRTVVCPFIDVIDHDNFHYRAQDEGARGSWDWELYYKRLPLLPEDLKHPSKPFKSPVMAGGLFAISAKWFWELGGYDPQLDIWGGEQYELSFKLWQCGGQMVDAPCSRIGHIYRKYSPFSSSGHGDFLARNYK